MAVETRQPSSSAAQWALVQFDPPRLQSFPVGSQLRLGGVFDGTERGSRVRVQTAVQHQQGWNQDLPKRQPALQV